MRVAEESTAARAGVLPGDVVVLVGEHDIAGAEDLVAAARRLVVGNRVVLEVVRNGARRAFEAIAKPLPSEGPHVTLDEVSLPAGRLRAIYTVPAGTPRGAVFYLQSSDWGSCEHALRPGHPVRRLIEGFHTAGWATLRIERSGTGDSEGPPCAEVDFETELGGYRAGLDQLCERYASVFLFGNSLGGMVAPLIANEAIAGIAVIGTSAATWHECLLGSFRREAEREGRTGIDDAERLLAELQTHVFRGRKTPAQIYAEHLHLREAGFAHLEGERAHGRTVRFFQQLEAADLADAWSRVPVPVLALHGSEDWICTEDDARNIAEYAPQGEHRELAGVDHGLTLPAAVDTVVSVTAAWMRAQTETDGSGSGHTHP